MIRARIKIFRSSKDYWLQREINSFLSSLEMHKLAPDFVEDIKYTCSLDRDGHILYTAMIIVNTGNLQPEAEKLFD
jgi:hypothetical protein